MSHAWQCKLSQLSKTHDQRFHWVIICAVNSQLESRKGVLQFCGNVAKCNTVCTRVKYVSQLGFVAVWQWRSQNHQSLCRRVGAFGRTGPSRRSWGPEAQRPDFFLTFFTSRIKSTLLEKFQFFGHRNYPQIMRKKVFENFIIIIIGYYELALGNNLHDFEVC